MNSKLKSAIEFNICTHGSEACNCWVYPVISPPGSFVTNQLATDKAPRHQAKTKQSQLATKHQQKDELAKSKVVEANSLF